MSDRIERIEKYIVAHKTVFAYMLDMMNNDLGKEDEVVASTTEPSESSFFEPLKRRSTKGRVATSPSNTNVVGLGMSTEEERPIAIGQNTNFVFHKIIGSIDTEPLKPFPSPGSATKRHVSKGTITTSPVSEEDPSWYHGDEHIHCSSLIPDRSDLGLQYSKSPTHELHHISDPNVANQLKKASGTSVTIRSDRDIILDKLITDEEIMNMVIKHRQQKEERLIKLNYINMRNQMRQQQADDIAQLKNTFSNKLHDELTSGTSIQTLYDAFYIHVNEEQLDTMTNKEAIEDITKHCVYMFDKTGISNTLKSWETLIQVDTANIAELNEFIIFERIASKYVKDDEFLYNILNTLNFSQTGKIREGYNTDAAAYGMFMENARYRVLIKHKTWRELLETFASCDSRAKAMLEEFDTEQE